MSVFTNTSIVVFTSLETSNILIFTVIVSQTGIFSVPAPIICETNVLHSGMDQATASIDVYFVASGVPIASISLSLASSAEFTPKVLSSSSQQRYLYTPKFLHYYFHLTQSF